MRVQEGTREYVDADEKEYITGTVSRIQEYGAFIQLKEGVDGLVHISSPPSPSPSLSLSQTRYWRWRPSQNAPTAGRLH